MSPLIGALFFTVPILGEGDGAAPGTFREGDCVKVVAQVRAYYVDPRTNDILDRPVNFLYPGERFPVKSFESETKQVEIAIENLKFMVNADKLVASSSGFCRMVPLSVTIKPGSLVRSLLHSSKPVPIKTKSTYKSLSRVEYEGTEWLRMLLGTRFFWMKAADIESTSESMSFIPLTPNWRLGFYATYGMAYSGSPYEDFVEKVEDKTDMPNEPDPLITEINSGSGFQIGVIYNHQIWNWLYGQIGVGYSQKQFIYDAKKNPDPGTTDFFDDLPDTTGTIDVKTIHFDLGLKYEPSEKSQVFGAIRWSAMIDTKIDYFFEGQEEIKLLTGNIFKATEVKAKAGPTDIDFQFWPRVEFTYRNLFANIGVSFASEFELRMGYWLF